jgi:hypothetical protein
MDIDKKINENNERPKENDENKGDRNEKDRNEKDRNEKDGKDRKEKDRNEKDRNEKDRNEKDGNEKDGKDGKEKDGKKTKHIYLKKGSGRLASQFHGETKFAIERKAKIIREQKEREKDGWDTNVDLY